jgi:hypothetical protein
MGEHEDPTMVALLKARLEITKLREENADLRAKLKRYDWRPIAEMHEDHSTCVVIDIRDPGSVQVMNVCDTDYNPEDWTHFAMLPELTNEMAEKLIAEMTPTTTEVKL